jgi:hypothetical protein
MGGNQSSDKNKSPSPTSEAPRQAVRARGYRIGQHVQYRAERDGFTTAARVEHVHRDGTLTLDCVAHRVDARRVRPAHPTEQQDLAAALDALAERAAPLVEQIRSLCHRVDEMYAARAPPAERELRRIESEGRALLPSLRLCCSEMRSLPLRRGSPLHATRDEAVQIASDSIHAAEALGAALGAELQERAPSSSSSPSLRDRTGALYYAGDAVQYSSDTHNAWVAAQITHVGRGSTLDLQLLSSVDVPRELRGTVLQGVSPHKIRRRTHRAERLPPSPVPGSAGDASLRRIQTNGGEWGRALRVTSALPAPLAQRLLWGVDTLAAGTQARSIGSAIRWSTRPTAPSSGCLRRSSTSTGAAT